MLFDIWVACLKYELVWEEYLGSLFSVVPFYQLLEIIRHSLRVDLTADPGSLKRETALSEIPRIREDDCSVELAVDSFFAEILNQYNATSVQIMQIEQKSPRLPAKFQKKSDPS